MEENDRLEVLRDKNIGLARDNEKLRVELAKANKKITALEAQIATYAESVERIHSTERQLLEAESKAHTLEIERDKLLIQRVDGINKRKSLEAQVRHLATQLKVLKPDG